jgi:RHS repeat-associated protein
MANGATTEFVFNASGARVSEWNAATHAQLNGNYYWQGKPLAYYTTAADTSSAVGIHFEHQNYLGTERMRTMPTGPYNSSSPNYAVEANFAEQPFGDNKLTFPGTVIETSFDTDANHYAFLDTDKETATDHADFRQYSNAQGRWMAPDPYDGSYSFGNPQSLNRYVYAMNSPLSYTDGNGEDICGFEDGSTLEGPAGSGCNTTYTPDASWGGAPPSPQQIMQNYIYSWMYLMQQQGLQDGSDDDNQDQGCDGGGDCPVLASNNDAKKNACVQNALLQGTASVAIDAIGLIPEAGGAARMYGNWRGYRGIVADQFGAKVIGQIKNGKYAAAGASLGGGPLGGGMFDTSAAGLMSTGLTVAGFIPGLGQVSAGLSMGVDAYKTWQAVKKCGE